VNKSAASATKFAKCVLLHAYSLTAVQKLYIAYITSWHTCNSILVIN